MVSETHLPGKADSLSALRAGMTLPALSDKESLAGSSVALLACPSRTAQRWSVATTTSDRTRQTHLRAAAE